MEYNTALMLKDSWGKKTCDHPDFEKVFYNGAFLINYVCTICGTDFTIAEKMTIEEIRKNREK